MQRRHWMYAVLLAVVAVFGPFVAFAGVSAVWPSSDQSADVDTSPPISFAAGDDHSQANSIGFAGAFSSTNNGGSYDLTVSGLSGGQVTIDKLVNISKDAAVSSYKIEISTALAGTLSDPTTLKMRFYTGATAPSADGDAQVCAVLDLEAAVDTESSTACSGATVHVQLIYELPDSSSGSSTVSIRPSSIVFA